MQFKKLRLKTWASWIVSSIFLCCIDFKPNYTVELHFISIALIPKSRQTLQKRKLLEPLAITSVFADLTLCLGEYTSNNSQRNEDTEPDTNEYAKDNISTEASNKRDIHDQLSYNSVTNVAALSSYCKLSIKNALENYRT